MTFSFFRSEDMILCQVLLHVDNAFNCLMELGHNGGLQFNNVYDEDRILNGLYTKKVLLCFELLRLVEYLEDQMSQLGISQTFFADVDSEDRPRESDITIYELHVKRLNRETVSVMEHYKTLERRYSYLQQKRYAILFADKILVVDGQYGSELLYSESTIMNLVKDQSEGEPTSTQLNFFLGSINVDKFAAFELMMYRFFGRNLLIRHAQMPEKVMETRGSAREFVHKLSILMITITSSYRPKIIKTCQVFHVTIFECPETRTLRRQMVKQLDKDMKELDAVLKETLHFRKRILHIAATDTFIIRINLGKALKVYDLMNRLNAVGGKKHQKYLQGECFVPQSDLGQVRQSLMLGIRDRDGSEDTTTPPILIKRHRKYKHMPPTYFRLNKFTRGFQNLIDSYGMADYRELNPAPYTVITFPFLFAIMFGDLGHGILLTIFASVLLIYEKKIEEDNRASPTENEILNILFAGRYIILLMGIFSIYVGIIYNDFASMAINIFGSSWSCAYNATLVRKLTSRIELNPNSLSFFSGHPYPFGLDPIWKICGEDSITTFNSLKMKLAIILGVAQMMFGLLLAAVNCCQQKRLPDLFLVIVPQTIFMICLFCYLVFLIFFKWLTFGGLNPAPHNSACAPSVLITFIDMMLMKTTPVMTPGCKQGMFWGERTLEYVLVFVAFAAVPILLAGKPIYLTLQQKRLRAERQKKEEGRDLSSINEQKHDNMQEMINSESATTNEEHQQEKRVSKLQRPTTSFSKPQKGARDADEHDLSEIWIHSGIHTIESVLGSVSHTASYLRLWALSLAHSQLADVLWNMILSRGLRNNLPLFLGVPVLAAIFFIWAVLTVAILVMMEGLSAFLHTLRLHWVEFQSKFFSGSGVPFRPFYFPRSTIRS